MDPYKVLGVDAHKIKDKESLEYLRQKAKRLWKEHADKKQKFEMKKVNEAFEMIKRNLLRPEQEIRRSRKEREMDALYSRQTKEITKRAKRAREHASSSSRIKRRRRLKLRAAAKARQRIRAKRLVRKKPPPTGTTEGLRRVLDILLNPDTPSPKYCRAVKLLKKWASDYCTPCNREYLFEVLCQICDAKVVAKEAEAAKDTVGIFAKIFCDAPEWFQQSPDHQRMRKWWDIAGVWNNELYTDDSHTFSRVMQKLQETLEELETRPMDAEESDNEDINEEDGEGEDGEGEDGEGEEGEDEEGDDEDEEGEEEGDEEKDGTSKSEKIEIKTELSPDVPASASNAPCPSSPSVPGPHPLSSQNATHSSAVKEENLSESEEEIDEEDDPFGDLRAMREQRREKRRMEREGAKVKSEEGANVKIEEGQAKVKIEREQDTGVNVIDVCNVKLEARAKIEKKEEIKQEGPASEASTMPEVEQPDPNFLCMIPSEVQIFDKLREHFVLCLENLFKKRAKTLWTRDQIDRFFQDVYYKRDRFTESQQESISRMQGAIKNKQKGVSAIGANACPLLAHVPVVDGRDTTTFGGGDQAWALKQF